MKHCLNIKILAALAVTTAGVYLLAPDLFISALPFLILAACPLSMVVMMRRMGSKSGPDVDRDGDGHGDGGGDEEVAKLRAEVDRLRRDRDAGSEVS